MNRHSFRLSQLCEAVGGELLGDDIEISGAAGIDAAWATIGTWVLSQAATLPWRPQRRRKMS